MGNGGRRLAAAYLHGGKEFQLLTGILFFDADSSFPTIVSTIFSTPSNQLLAAGDRSLGISWPLGLLRLYTPFPLSRAATHQKRKVIHATTLIALQTDCSYYRYSGAHH